MIKDLGVDDMKVSSLILTMVITMALFSGCGTAGNTREKVDLTKVEIMQAVNSAPVATFDTFNINRDSRYDGQLTATDSDGDALKYIIVNPPKHGTVVLHNNGCFTYTPDRGYQGGDTFSYKASDDMSSCALKIVTVDICEPIAVKPTSPTNLLVVALSSTKLELTWKDNADNEEGFVIYQEGKLIATAHRNETKKVISCGLKSATSYIFEVRAKNKAGVSEAIFAQGRTKDVTMSPDTPTKLKAKSIGETCLRLEWKDNANNESGYEIYQDSKLIKTISAGSQCTIVSALQPCASYTFMVKAINKIGVTRSNIITVNTICAVMPSASHSPVAIAQSIILDENTSKTIILSGSDEDGDTLTYSVVTSPSHGTFDGELYTPIVNYYGSDSFTFQAHDGKLDSTPSTVSITINPINDEPANADNSNILFAHGYKGSSASWDFFADYITDNHKPWNVYRTSVGKDDSIAVRAAQLAKYINSKAEIADASLVTLGHSMGGLDLRYIVSQGHKHQEDKTNIFYKAAKKIKVIYTFATPHKGINDIGVDDATNDMTKANMKIFNEANPYSIFDIEDRKIPLLAYRFVCDDERVSDGSASESDGGNDGLLKVKTQIFNGAPLTQSVFSGKHTDDTLCMGSYLQEKERTDLLENILNDQQPYIDTKDIVFFNDGSCQGEEGGVFSSTHKAGGVNCLVSDSCEDNKISSLMIFPGIKKETVIELYSDHNDDGSDDWSIININQATLTKPLCINSFETGISDDANELGITMEYHEKLGLENGLDGKVSYIKID